MTQDISHNYYKELIDLHDVEGVESQIRSLLMFRLNPFLT
jgi:oligoendopeptidase F